VYSCSEKKIRAGFGMSDRTIPLLVAQKAILLQDHVMLESLYVQGLRTEKFAFFQLESLIKYADIVCP
jgi:hypothetical protein